jgi:hypothetical protein
VLRRHRRLLSPDGVVLCAAANAQHHAQLWAWLSGEFPPAAAGSADGAPRRSFTYASLIRLLLDAGYAPAIAQTLAAPCPPELLAACGPLLRQFGLHPGRTHTYLGISHYLFRGTPVPDPDAGSPAAEADAPLSFVACVSDEASLHANLLRSPCLGPGSPHEVLLLRGCRSAAEGLNQGLARARNRLVVWVHQDVYLPAGWPGRFVRQCRLAEQAFGRVGVFGVCGVTQQGALVTRAGHVVDRDRLLHEPAPLPAVVDTLDGVLLAFPQPTPLALDPRLGFHFYDADVCLAARRQGLAAVAVDALWLPPLAERRPAAGLLRQRPGLRPQVGRPLAGGHVVRCRR